MPTMMSPPSAFANAATSFAALTYLGFDAVTTMAHKDGVSVSDWIARTVEAGLRR